MPLADVFQSLKYGPFWWREKRQVLKADFRQDIDKLLAQLGPEEKGPKTFDEYEYQPRPRERVFSSPSHRSESTYMKGERSRHDNGKSQRRVHKAWQKRA